MSRRILLTILLLGLAGTTHAAMQTVTLSVPDMYCEVCPITVKKALQKVTGVGAVRVSLEAKEAVVTYDDAKTAPTALQEATSKAGYPSTVKKAKP